jgi:CBS domain-containing protein
MKKAAGGKGNKAQLQAMQAMMEQMFGGTIPTLRSILSGHSYESVRASANVREAATLMATSRKGVLVMDDDELVGIFTPKDILCRIVAKEKSPDLTSVASVMTANPDCVSPDLTLLDALKEMHDHKYLHLPVRDDDGEVLGLVDVMELLCSTAGGEKGWRDFFNCAMDSKGGDDDKSDVSSIRSSVRDRRDTVAESPEPLKAKYIADDSSDVFSVGDNFKLNDVSYSDTNAEFTYKVTDHEGNTHRIKTSCVSVEVFKVAIAEKMNVPKDGILIKYVDDEKDEILITTDGSLKDAVEFARSNGLTLLKLTTAKAPVKAVTFGAVASAATSLLIGSSDASGNKEHGMSKMKKNVIIGGGIAAAIGVLAIGFFATRKKN